MKKLLTLILVMVFVLGLIGGVALAEEHCEQRYGQGYWKQWLAEKAEDDPEWLCSMDFTAEQLLYMLNTPAGGNATQILLYQFIAAALNANPELNGCIMTQEVEVAFYYASLHLLDVLGGGEGTGTRQEILEWKDILEHWNENE